MTGFGDARGAADKRNVAVEVKAVNSRYLKIVTKTPDAYVSLENRIEKAVRAVMVRGSVTVNLRVTREDDVHPFELNQSVIRHYWEQIRTLSEHSHVPEPQDLSSLLMLPGTIVEDFNTVNVQEEWPLISEVLSQALENLQAFRVTEGESMQAELVSLCAQLSQLLNDIQQYAPEVINEYRTRLRERMQDLLKEHDVSVDDTQLLREVGLFTDRSDITEEIARLGSHISQMTDYIQKSESQGRKLDFLSQEMFREINTIGSKANNVKIAHLVVDMKVCVEKIREILQNVE